MYQIKEFTTNDYQAVSDIENTVFTDEFFTAQSFIETDERRPEYIKQGRFMARLESRVSRVGKSK